MKETTITTTCDRCSKEKQKGAMGWVEFTFHVRSGDLCRPCSDIVRTVIFYAEKLIKKEVIDGTITKV